MEDAGESVVQLVSTVQLRPIRSHSHFDTKYLPDLESENILNE